ncbi:MAG: hypothetical protein KAS32_14825 [Candidatus Peribacteraceae bacterium]|nr:hypothetical protein [Candidatus Peribacteraceae bacterium]
MTEYNDAMYIDELRERIERLEQERDQLKQFQQSLHPTELRDYMKTYYVIIDEQIAAVVEWANTFGASRTTEGRWDVLNKLNIFRCENNLFQGTDHHGCSYCNGKGYVTQPSDGSSEQVSDASTIK